MNNDNDTITNDNSDNTTREPAPRKRGRKPSAVKAEKAPNEPRQAYEAVGLISAALEAIAAVTADDALLFDKKGIAQIVKAAVELREAGKTARLRGSFSEVEGE